MAIVQRSFLAESDKYRMAALAAQSPAANLHVTDLPYRLSSWALDDPANVRLWFDGDGELVAWVVLQTPFWTIDYVCHPDHEADLHAQILAWADQRAIATLNTVYGHPSWYIDVFTGQTGRIRDLEKAGFTNQADLGEDSLSKVLMERSARTPVRLYNPPPGFAVRPLAGEDEVEAYVELHRSVFESKNMTVEWRNRTLQHPDYRPELDVVVASLQGQLAAFCIGWFDAHSRQGRVEPLGCHQDFRCHALGRVALSHVLQRLQAMGAQTIQVETDSFRNTAYQLYESFDFQVIQHVFVYRKDYECDCHL